MNLRLDLAAAIPGGILPTDVWHRTWHDGTCSRCRLEVPDEQVPLMLWSADGNDMLVYCEPCISPQEARSEAEPSDREEKDFAHAALATLVPEFPPKTEGA